MKTSKAVLLAVLILLAVPISIAHGADPILVGLMAPMTGDYAEYGMFFREGVQLAMDEINKGGGINGQQVELVVGDSRADPKEAA
ncbi:MAG TPA: ABC transporter substrate-binding protein, partial [Thermodesulfobacteriota bacterium]|nr:ABC transporter substrate-binding protein [Thermodesulfobacteriota bacterium]